MKTCVISLCIISSFLGAPLADAKARAAAKSENGAPGRTADGKPSYYEDIYDRTIKDKPVEEYFAAVNGGWQENLGTLRRYLKSDASYVVLHAQEPKDVFDLRSPEHFKKGLLRDGIFKMAKNTLGIGHVFLSWRCQIGGKAVEGTAGVTGELSDQFKDMIEKGWGLSTFAARFEDGHLQTPALLDFEFSEELPVHTLAVEVSPEVCENARAFVKQYLAHENEPRWNFGLGLDPGKFEGGGCGSFGATVMAKSGVFGRHEVVGNFWRTLQGRKSLFGYGLELPEDSFVDDPVRSTGRHKVSKEYLFLAANWNASSKKNSVPIPIMDPEMLLLFFKTTYRAFLDDLYRANLGLARQFKQSPLYQLRTAAVNELQVKSWEQGIFHVTTTDAQRIDSRFDPQAAMVVANTRAWIRDLKRQGYRGHPALVGRGESSKIGVVLDRR